MALAKVTMTTRSGGRQTRPNGARVAKSICALVVSPKGTPNTVLRIDSPTSISKQLDMGKGADIAALCGASFVVVLNPSTTGALSAAVTKTGDGTATIVPSLAPHRLIEIKITVAGALGTMKYRYRVGGVGAWSAEITSTAVAYSIRIPGTFTTLTFAAGTYVLNSTYTIATNGVITLGGSAINTVTQVSSPLDDYDFAIVVKKAGGLGTAMLAVSVDGGNATGAGRSFLPDVPVPSGGVIVIEGTGVVLTCSGTFVADEVYSFLALAPQPTNSDITNAVNAAVADKPASVGFSLLLLAGMPASAAAAISAAATLNTAIESAETNYGAQWQGFCDSPLVGDAVISGGNAVADTADDSAAQRTAREGQNLKHTAVFYGTTRMTGLNGWKLKRGRSVVLAKRFNETDPGPGMVDRELGPLTNVFAQGVDAADFVELDDVQLNGLQEERHLGEGSFPAITSGGYGVKNLTTDDDYQDADGVRALNCALRALRPVLEKLKGSRPETNPDGTILEEVAVDWDVIVDTAIKAGVGLASGAFAQPQVSSATARILRTSQLGQTPHKLEAEYEVQKRGMVSDVEATGTYSGVLSV